MMTPYEIICPIQTTETFNVERCLSCKYFDLHVGKRRSYVCRKNRSKDGKSTFTDICIRHFYGFDERPVEIKEG